VRTPVVGLAAFLAGVVATIAVVSALPAPPATSPRYERFALPARCASDPSAGWPRPDGCAWSLNELLRGGWEVERIEQADGYPLRYHVRRPQR
jgi:hypothetical protein